jgi:DNA-binding transcriptional ArsR family regulator
MGLLPSKPDLSADADADPRVVGVDSEDADDLMSALTSRTARRLLSILHEEPAPPSGLADQVDTSLQNVQYHLERLEDAGAVEVVGTAYSEKGREMDVYAPADEPLVIYAGREEEASGLRAALSRLVSGVVALAVGAVAVQEAFGEGIPFPVAQTGGGGGDAGGTGGADGADGGDGGGAGSADAPEPTPTPEDGGVSLAEAPTETPTPAAEPTAETVTPAPTEAVETTTGTAAPAATGTPAPTPAATETPAPAGTPTPVGTPSPVATEAATPVPTEEATPMATAEPTPSLTATEVATEAVRTVTEAGGGTFEPAGLPPGLLFVLGGALVLVAAVALTYGR